MIRSLLRALRVGASVQTTKEMKWAGVVAAVTVFALNVAKANGVLADVAESEAVHLALVVTESVLAIFAAYSQIASTDKIGVLPRKGRRIEAMSDEEINDLLDRRESERMRADRLPPRSDAPETRNSAGFPDGPFFDS